MLQFFKYVFATLTGLVIFCFLSLLLIIGGGMMLGSSEDDSATIKENTILKLNLNKPIVENAILEKNPMSAIGGPFVDNSDKIGLVQIKEALESAAKDEKVKGIFLQTESPEAGFATIEEVRNALIAFKKSGKFIYTYGESYSDKGYYLASLADKIYLNPVGNVDFKGISVVTSFFKGTLEKLEIKPVIFKVGEFKSAVEPLIREDMSEPNRLQLNSFLNSINNHVFAEISKSRNISIENLKVTADSLKAFTPKGALESKLITNIAYFDEFETALRKVAGMKEDDDFEFVGLKSYQKSLKNDKSGDNHIAVIVAEGEIVGSRGSKGKIGSDDFTKELRKAKDDEHVKAIVVRISSPGGSALASDVMWREIQLAKKVKPVIASMGDYAASGGYYMAMGADYIIAQPTTITGSIGIFGMFYNFENFLKNKLGITNDRVKTNANADFISATREFSPQEATLVQRFIEEGYETFTSKAAQGRKMSIEKLKSLASGRVWSGKEAKENGLVDELGGLQDAINYAAKKVNLKNGNYSTVYYPSLKPWYESLLNNDDNEEVEAKILEAQLGKKITPYLKEIKRIQHSEGVMMAMPYKLELE